MDVETEPLELRLRQHALSRAQKMSVIVQELPATAIDFHDVIDFTTSPDAPMASFPFPSLPPMRHLDDDGALELFDVRRMRTTVVGVALAAAATAIAVVSAWGRSPAPPPTILGTAIAAAVAVGAAATVAFPPKLRFAVTHSANVATNGGATCHVVERTLTISNSHAGTHADMPSHFIPPPLAPPPLPSTWYNGRAVLVDVGADIRSRGGESKAIDSIVVSHILHRMELAGVPPGSVRRLLLTSSHGVTRRSWGDYSYFTPSGAEALCRACSSLLLVAVDSPSVDAPTQSPLIDGAHGVFFGAAVAVVENINPVECYAWIEAVGAVDRLAAEGHDALVAEGMLMCAWNPMQLFDDSWGCSVLFLPFLEGS